MKTLSNLLIICFVLLFFLPEIGTTQDFTIKNFDASILIHEDGSITVSEKIEVLFHRSRHGIYREIPYKYKNDLGQTVRMPIDVFSVTDENQNDLTAKISNKGNVVNIRIGDADKYIRGTHYYVISYKVKNCLLYFDDHDELYWNVTGNYWNAPIEKATASVTIKTNKEIGQQDYACYTGSYGSTKTRCEFYNGTFSTTAPLEPNEGFTIAYGFNKGIVAKPSAFDKFILSLNLPENWGFILPIISFLFMITHWRKKGRDPKVRQAIMVRYDPPKINDKELTAAEVGTLIDETMNPRDISASMIGLAVKGYLKIEETEEKILFFTQKDYKLTALKSEINELTEFERWLMIGLFPDGQSVVMISELKNKFYKYLPKLKKAVFKQLVSYKYFATSPQHTIGKYVGFGILVLILTALSQLMFSSYDFPIKPIIISILTASPFFIFSKAMPAKTRIGSLALSGILGFQEFLERAEKDKLERMQDKDLFSKYLPYAIALDIVDQWAKAFEGIEQNIPSWYIGAHGMTYFHPVAFSNAINTTTSHLSTATFSAPRSSGTSGGGGFSGGGGGGGGGGSW